MKQLSHCIEWGAIHISSSFFLFLSFCISCSLPVEGHEKLLWKWNILFKIARSYFFFLECSKIFTACSTSLQRQGRVQPCSSKTLTSILQSLTFSLSTTKLNFSLLEIYGTHKGGTMQEKSSIAVPEP